MLIVQVESRNVSRYITSNLADVIVISEIKDEDGNIDYPILMEQLGITGVFDNSLIGLDCTDKYALKTDDEIFVLDHDASITVMTESGVVLANHN